MGTTKRICARCSKEFFAREADVRRGWARFCSKSCKATAQEARTGQYRGLLAGRCFGSESDFDGGWDEHKKESE